MAQLILTCGNLEAIILDNRQLVSLKDNNHQFMHQGGDPENVAAAAQWPHSEFLMGPIVGPTEHGYVKIDGVQYQLDRHGFLRHVTYDFLSNDTFSAGFEFKYQANTLIKSTTDSRNFSFPHSFSVERNYALGEKHLYIQYSIKNDSDYPIHFESGWHPGLDAPDREGDHDVCVGNDTFKFSDIAHGKSEVRKYVATSSYFYSGNRKVMVTSNLPNKMIWRKPGTTIFGDEPNNHLPRDDMLHFTDSEPIEARGIQYN